MLPAALLRGKIYTLKNQWTTPRRNGWNTWLSHKFLRHLKYRWYLPATTQQLALFLVTSVRLHSVSSRTTSIDMWDKNTDNLGCKEQPTTGYYASRWNSGFSSVRHQTAALLNLRFSFHLRMKISEWLASMSLKVLMIDSMLDMYWPINSYNL
jgi:hypothetical protein